MTINTIDSPLTLKLFVTEYLKELESTCRTLHGFKSSLLYQVDLRLPFGWQSSVTVKVAEDQRSFDLTFGLLNSATNVAIYTMTVNMVPWWTE